MYIIMYRQYFEKPDDGDVNEYMPGALLARVASSLALISCGDVRI
jgi:hypothetical protein